MKKTLLASTLLALGTGAFAYDEYGTVAKGKVEVDLMYTHQFISGGYDDNGDKQDAEGSPAVMTPSLQLKYGIIDGLDVELGASYVMTNKDAGDLSGLGKPSLDVKYVHASGFGGLIGVDLPLGSEDIVGSDPTLALRVGPVLAKTIDKVVLNGWALATINFEDKDKNKAPNGLDVYFKPQYNVNDQVGPYLGLQYQTPIGDAKRDGVTEKAEGYLVTVKPGINYVINSTYSCELNVPVTVVGKSATASTSVYVGFYGVF